MKKNQKRMPITVLGLIVALAVFAAVRAHFFSSPDEKTASSIQLDGIVAPGKVTMIDLGATECIPCKMMAPIIEDLKKSSPAGPILFSSMWGKTPPMPKSSVSASFRRRYLLTPKAGRFTAIPVSWIKSGLSKSCRGWVFPDAARVLDDTRKHKK